MHTHTKSDITDFPAYGNTAGTICEGNDSRLSDARTPVAHTHTKSDVTDLFNSANTWSGENSFTAANINIKSSNFSLGDTVSSNQVKRFQWYDASNNRYACIAVNYATDKSVWIDIPLRTKNTEGTSFVDKGIRFQVKPDNTSAFLPVTNSVTDLGSSSYQWNNLYAKKVNTQSVNGINPGALSLPGAYLGINDQIKDPNGQLNAFDLNGGSNTWVSDVDCYLYFYIPNNKFTWIRIFWPPTLVRCGQTFVPVPNESSDYSGFVPVPANTTVVIQVKGTQAPVFRRSACLGNV